MGEDIILLAEHLLKIFNIEFKKQVRGFSDDARQVLLNYHWPGNVRELSNCLERTMIFIEKDCIEAEDLAILAPKPSQANQAPHQWTLPPNGIILVTGPTGSGKTTSLYAVLSSINTPDINITSLPLGKSSA